ncbi:hypothetical protein POM88_050346 [Heracleum sosnowskyi]|uniref:Transcription repressor n=1 Tax=Heracleum sosnowskyi TaxID=360622 RepID=A0AAD8M0B0_9APIA|nr:hypothetical protein POM88_050346 [Heracleum sosnowskyi]
MKAGDCWPDLLKLRNEHEHPAVTGRSLVKFEGGYTVETLFYGSKHGIEPYSVELSPTGDLLVLDCENSNLYKISTPLHMMGEAISSLAVKDLKNLEGKLEKGISRIRSKKNELLFAEVEYMQKRRIRSSAWWSQPCLHDLPSVGNVYVQFREVSTLVVMSGMDPFILLVIVELNQPLSSKEAQRNLKTHVAKKNDNIGDEKSCLVRKLRVNSVGVKLRANSRRIASKKLTQVQCRESVSSHSHLMSVAIVEESIDPDRDFKESMMEMIMEHNMSTKEEFEQLLACYLSLNPGIYHELIVKVFKQIWFEITGN